MPEFPIHNSPYFDVREWVDKRTWDALGAQSASLIDPAIIRVADLLRSLSGPLTVNNWHTRRGAQKGFNSSGFRAVWDRTGAQLSQHRCGRAGDFKSSRYTTPVLLKIVMDNAEAFRAVGLTTIENIQFTPTWLHLDCRPVVPGFWPEDAPFRVVSPA
jgi:hypothetical protein